MGFKMVNRELLPAGVSNYLQYVFLSFFTNYHKTHLWARLTFTLGKAPPSRRNDSASLEPSLKTLTNASLVYGESNHSWRPHTQNLQVTNNTGQRCGYLYLSTNPEENGLPWNKGYGNEGKCAWVCVCMCVCVCVSLVLSKAQWMEEGLRRKP